MVIGTIQCMASEQIEGKEADARSDLFELGAVLYEMATGKRPFEGKSQNSVASAILEKDPEPIRTLKPLTPAAFERVVSSCLAKNPEDRFESGHAVRLQLEWIAEELPLRGLENEFQELRAELDGLEEEKQVDRDRSGSPIVS
jgi:eukaryotic-like serine/threonine-protein kinase